jgi:hypothetical protein
MKRASSLLLLFALAVPGWGQSVVLPKTLDAKAGRPIFLSPLVDGDDLKWEIDAGLDDWVAMLPPEVAKNFGQSKIFYGEKGTYTIRAWTAKVVDGKAKLSPISTCIITVDGGRPPPVPDPPPVPTSALQRSLQAAFTLDTDTDRTAKVAALADLWGNFVPAAKKSGTVTTSADLMAKGAAAANIAVGPSATTIPNVRKAIGVYLQSVLGSTSVAADEAFWTRADTEFRNVATALKGLK